MRKITVFLSVLLAACLIVTSVPAESMTLYSDPYAMETTYRRLVDGWVNSLKNTEAEVVFLGDSLTLGGAWDEFFPEYMVANLGVVGDILYGITIRVPLVETLVPSKCFLMGGINNLAYGEDVSQTLIHYEELLMELHQLQQENGMTVYVQSVLPIHETICGYQISNQDIQRLNDGIQQLADQYQMIYVDVYHGMLNDEQMLHEDYTVDGLHLSAQGYITWMEILQPYMDE